MAGRTGAADIIAALVFLLDRGGHVLGCRVPEPLHVLIVLLHSAGEGHRACRLVVLVHGPLEHKRRVVRLGPSPGRGVEGLLGQGLAKLEDSVLPLERGVSPPSPPAPWWASPSRRPALKLGLA